MLEPHLIVVRLIVVLITCRIRAQTAEMPDFYNKGEYDLSGFAVGVVKKDELIDGSRIRSGDVLLGIPSTGVHSNGFSLVRKYVRGREPAHALSHTHSRVQCADILGRLLFILYTA